jgi:hypothetical protein
MYDHGAPIDGLGEGYTISGNLSLKWYKGFNMALND